MERRKFLKIAGISTAAIASVPGLAFLIGSTKDTAVDLILKRYHFLRIDQSEAERYVTDYMEQNPVYNSTPSKIKLKSRLYLNVKTQRSEMIVDEFLQATDFFINKMDESKEVKYVALYNPHKQPCSNNPFSHVFYPPEMRNA